MGLKLIVITANRKATWTELGESEGKLEFIRANRNQWGQNRTHSYLSHWWCRRPAQEVNAFTTELHVCLAPEACCSVAQSYPTLCNPMDCRIPGFPVLHCLPESAQTHLHWVDDAIQPSHSLSPLSPHALSLSQHQGLFPWIGSLYWMAAEARRSWNRRCGGRWRSWGPVAALHQQGGSRSVKSLQAAAGTWHQPWKHYHSASLAPFKSYPDFSCDQSCPGTRLGKEIWGTEFQLNWQSRKPPQEPNINTCQVPGCCVSYILMSHLSLIAVLQDKD